MKKLTLFLLFLLVPLILGASEIRSGEVIKLQVIEVILKQCGEKSYYTSKYYEIRRQVIKVYKINQFIVVHIRLKKEDINSQHQRLYFYKGAIDLEIYNRRLLGVLKMRRY